MRSDDKIRTHQIVSETEWMSSFNGVDTGAAVSVIGETVFNKIRTGLQPLALTKTSARLGNHKVMGTTHVPVAYGKQLVRLPLMVVEGSGPSLLG